MHVLSKSVSKNYSSLLSSAMWPQVESKLLAGASKDFRTKESFENFKVILANTRQALLSDTTISN